MPAPQDGLSLEDEQQITSLLLKCGADITEMNTVRRHLSKVKGGQLGKLAIQNGATCISFILSDTVGDQLEVIAGGPTVVDPTTFRDALGVLEQYGIDKEAPVIAEHFRKGISGQIPDTLKSKDLQSNHLHSILIGSASTSAAKVQNHLNTTGWTCTLISNSLSGEASTFGYQLIDLISRVIPPECTSDKLAFVGSGEFTVSLKGKGTGGRNQEMLLAFLITLKNLKNRGEVCVLDQYEWTVIGAAFDGIEGNSPAMGAITGNQSLERCQGMDLEAILKNNDSYNLFKPLGDVIETGYTGTNVNDMLLILLQKRK